MTMNVVTFFENLDKSGNSKMIGKTRGESRKVWQKSWDLSHRGNLCSPSNYTATSLWRSFWWPSEM